MSKSNIPSIAFPFRAYLLIRKARISDRFDSFFRYKRLQRSLTSITYGSFVGPWNGQTTQEAAYAQSYDCLKYAIENGCSFNHRVTHGLAATRKVSDLQKSLEMLQYVHQLGCESNIYIHMRRNLIS
jgi:hypothetical protein